MKTLTSRPELFSVLATVHRRVELFVHAQGEHEAEEIAEARLSAGEEGLLHEQTVEVEGAELLEAHPNTDGTGFYT